MFNVKAFLAYRKAPKSDAIVLITSCVLTFAFDLVIAIEVGIVLSCVLFMKRMSDVTDVSGWKYIRDTHLPEEENDPEHISLKEVPEGTEVFEVNGPMFFGAVDKLLRLKHQTMKKDTKVVIIRMRGVPAIDVTAMNTLRDVTKDLKEYGITVIFSHVLEQPRSIMEKNGFINVIGTDNFCENIDAALERAAVVISADEAMKEAAATV